MFGRRRRSSFGPHALSPFPVSSKPIVGLEGRGAIVFRSEPVGSEVVAVVLVDGQPAAVGFGEGRIAVPAGERRVQFQAGRVCRTWRVVVPLGGGVALSSAEPERPLAPRPPGGAAVLRIEVGLDHRPEFPRPTVPFTRARPVRLGSQPVPGRKDDPDAAFTEAMGEELSGFGRWLRFEWDYLLRNMGWDADYRERRRRALLLDAARRKCAPWIDPPRITIGDDEPEAAWGVNEYRLDPGVHLVEIAVPAPPPRLDRGTSVDLPSSSTLLYELDLEPGTTTEIEALARVNTRLSDDGLGLAEYSGHIEAVRAPRSDAP